MVALRTAYWELVAPSGKTQEAPESLVRLIGWALDAYFDDPTTR